MGKYTVVFSRFHGIMFIYYFIYILLNIIHNILFMESILHGGITL